MAGTPGYTFSKFAVRGLTRNAALEYGRAGIRVNSIHPGRISTGLTRGLNSAGGAGYEGRVLDTLALGRTGAPAEIAAITLFLASGKSSFCTGAEFVGDGGRLAGMTSPEITERVLHVPFPAQV